MVRVCGECVWLVCVERIKWWVLVVGGGAVDITPPTPPHKRTGLTASCAAQSGDEYGWGWGVASDWARAKYSPQTDDP